MTGTGVPDSSGKCSTATGAQYGRRWSETNAAIVVVGFPDDWIGFWNFNGELWLDNGSHFAELQTLLDGCSWTLQIHIFEIDFTF